MTIPEALTKLAEQMPHKPDCEALLGNKCDCDRDELHKAISEAFSLPLDPSLEAGTIGQYKLMPAANPNVMLIHARFRFPQALLMDATLGFGVTEDFPLDIQKRHPFYNALASIDGLVSASGSDYVLQIQKAELFSFDEILPHVIAAINSHLADREGK